MFLHGTILVFLRQSLLGHHFLFLLCPAGFALVMFYLGLFYFLHCAKILATIETLRPKTQLTDWYLFFYVYLLF